MTATCPTKTSVRIQALLAATIAALAFAAAARADPVDLSIVDRETGQTLRTWRHHGRLYVAGQPGDRYSLRVSNHTDGRVMLVMSVDGVNIVTGETASYDQNGYVIAAHDSYDVTGWRKSNAEVAAFTFAALPQSYAARTGRPADVGVIGMAVFKEKAAPPPPMPEAWAGRPDEGNAPQRRYSSATRGRAQPSAPPMALPPPSPIIAPQSSEVVVTAERKAPAPAAKADAEAPRAADMARRDDKLGTAHGAREWSVVHLVNFERSTTYPQFTRQIEYDTYSNLVANGVISPYADASRHPRPFPSNASEPSYVPDPPEDR